jgi:hypothetical protein
LKKSLDVLVACEFSGIVREAFIRRGHNAWSCDFLDTRIPGPHYKEDIKKVLKKHPYWDIMIFHAPCTRLCNSGVRWLHERNLWKEMEEAALFFKFLLDFDCDKICGENPIPHKYALDIIGRKYTQIIQPWQFGHSDSKATCLWLKGLPSLKATEILDKPLCGHWSNQTPSGQNRLGPSEDRGLLRSITYKGIANAMSEQWG